MARSGLDPVGAHPPQVAEASKTYLAKQDPLAEWMETCCEHTAEGELTGETEELPFATWYWSFIEQSERDPKRASTTWFGPQLESHKFIKRAAYNGKFYTGPCLTAMAKHVANEAAEHAKWKERGYETSEDYTRYTRGSDGNQRPWSDEEYAK